MDILKCFFTVICLAKLTRNSLEADNPQEPNSPQGPNSPQEPTARTQSNRYRRYINVWLKRLQTEHLLIEANRQFWVLPLNAPSHDGMPCFIPPNTPIQHNYLIMRNVNIPMKQGIFISKPVEFIFANKSITQYVLLQCECEAIIPGRLTSAYGICVDNKIFLSRGVQGSRSFFLYTYNEESMTYNVITHIIV